MDANNLICVVDDEVSIIDFVRIYLERENFSVVAYMDGFSALNGIRRTQPALVVLDIMLPKMDGYDVCKTLRAEENEGTIIMLSAKDEDIDKILGLELGADDYLTKPFNPRELVARIKAGLRKNRLIIKYPQRLRKHMTNNLSLMSMANESLRFILTCLTT